MSPSTCDICKGLDESVSVQCGVPLPKLRQSSSGAWFSRGCQGCGVLVRSFQALKGEKGEDDQDEENVFLSWDTKRLDGLRIVARKEGAGFLTFGIDAYCLQGDQPPWKLKKHGEVATDISGDTSSDAAIFKIKQWIQDCAKNHSCKKSEGDRYLPARVLDISDPNLIRLHLATEDEVGEYACLSHCWGATRLLTTTSSNIESHERQIPWPKLPTAFQDAISVSRKLGIAYLWIDSLCIIQDSPQDWQAQSAEMASIYANSSITIAATMSTSDADSFLCRTPALYCSRKLTYKSDRGVPQTIRIRRTLSHGHGPSPFPLLNRGWVLQERLLSPRVVHFTPDELIWECMEKTTCECSCIRSLWAPGWVPFNKDMLYELNLARAEKTELTACWHQIVEQYSRLELSFRRDRLPAISGAAKRFASFKGCPYYAGLWKDSLIKDLMWVRKGSLDATRRLGHLPSWSWASIDSQVSFDAAVSTTELAVVLEVREQAAEKDEDSEANANLRFLTRELNARQGPAARPDQFTRPWHFMLVSGFLVPLQSLLDGDGPFTGQTTHHSGDPFVELGKLGEFVADIDEDTCEQCIGGVYLLRLATRMGVMGSGDNQEVSLVLFRIRSSEETYRRLGLLKRSFHTSAPEVDLFQDANEANLIHLV